MFMNFVTVALSWCDIYIPLAMCKKAMLVFINSGSYILYGYFHWGEDILYVNLEICKGVHILFQTLRGNVEKKEDCYRVLYNTVFFLET
jgi:hypothetical protein